MENTYYNKKDLKNFGKIVEWQKELGDNFFDYYEATFKEGSLTAREKSIIALAITHTVQCPYSIDTYTSDCLEKGVEEEQMMETIHVAAAIKSGASLVHGVQMMEQTKEKLM